MSSYPDLVQLIGSDILTINNKLINLDNTTTALAASAEYIGESKSTSGCGYLVGTIYSDQQCTLYIDQSQDNINWDLSSSFDVQPSVGQGFTVRVTAFYCRMRIINGNVAQSVLRAFLNKIVF